MPDALQRLVDIALQREPDGSFAMFRASEHFRLDAFGKLNPLTHRRLASGPYKRFPGFPVFRHSSNQEDLNAPGAAGAMPEQSRRYYLRIVEHEAITGLHELRQLAETAVLPRAELAIDHKHARPGAVCKWRLGDQLLKQVIMEIG